MHRVEVERGGEGDERETLHSSVGVVDTAYGTCVDREVLSLAVVVLGEGSTGSGFRVEDIILGLKELPTIDATPTTRS